MTKTLAIITVVYQNYTLLEDFLNDLRKQSDKNFYLIIVDLSKIREKINLKDLNGEIVNSHNLGYAHGVNVGIKTAEKRSFKYYCIINNDIFFGRDFTNKALNSIVEHPSAIIAGKIYYAPGYEYHKNRYKKQELGKVVWYAGGTFDWKNVLTPHLGVDEVDRGQFDKFKENDFVNGALFMFDKKVIEKVGYWDEGYFLYYEDADYCVRAKKAGVKLFYDPNVIIWHKVSQSTGGSGSLLHQKYQGKNRLKFGLKYAPFRTKLHLLKNYFLG